MFYDTSPHLHRMGPRSPPTNQINNQSTILSTDVIQLTLTLKMITAQVVESSVTVNNNSPIQDYVHPDDQTQPLEMIPGFKPFTAKNTLRFFLSPLRLFLRYVKLILRK